MAADLGLFGGLWRGKEIVGEGPPVQGMPLGVQLDQMIRSSQAIPAGIDLKQIYIFFRPERVSLLIKKKGLNHFGHIRVAVTEIRNECRQIQ